MSRKKVYIVGVGPGDWQLLTLKAERVIKDADVVVYDRLVSRKVISMINKRTEKIYVGKKPNLHIVPQERINEILIEKAKENKMVVRLKGGDPFVFGRGAEEIYGLVENDIPFEVIPGITSSISVPAYAGIPVTHRNESASFHVFTGHFKEGEPAEKLDFETLAKLEGTLIFLMGMKHLSDITKGLIKSGKDPLTPVAVIERGTMPSQAQLIGRLEDIAEKAKSGGFKPPAIIVIGDVVSHQETLSWFTNRPLYGKSIMVTRARAQASKLSSKLENLGANVIEVPTIFIDECELLKDDIYKLKNLNEYSWLIFTSVNGFEFFFKKLLDNKIDIRSLVGLKIAAIGKATKSVIEQSGIKVDFVPSNYNSDDMIKELLPNLNKGEKLLYIKGELAKGILCNKLSQNGFCCESLITYKTISQPLEENVFDNEVDVITFTSASTVNFFYEALSDDKKQMYLDVPCICIGPKTRESAEKRGFKNITVSEEATIDSVVKAVIDNFGGKNGH
ncbi:MAG: uroporphyrinogen-III C-methyltransferase [Clostridiales bacterium]|nr:MAG: uroporphyrinogen-III C-methyltransferase [Clostridiales bacterium]